MHVFLSMVNYTNDKKNLKRLDDNVGKCETHG